jgi:23S rRNA (uridine2552-2'-O)-methyltransferase
VASPRHKDAFYKKAQAEGFAARSVYKLEEIDKKFSVLAAGQTVLDLGCSPGSWLQYIQQRVGPHGRVLGVDLNDPRVRVGPNVKLLRADVNTVEPAAILEAIGRCDAVVSDMAPQTTGVKVADIVRSVALCERALDLALAVLRPEGHFVTKVFMGEGYQAVHDRAREAFRKTRHFKPQGTRKESREIYLVATCLRPEACSMVPPGGDVGPVVP